MKKLLILAYDFPPYVSVGGLRPYSWYKYLKEFDIEPIVITRNWSTEHGNALDYISPSVTNDTVVEKNEYGIVVRTPYKPNWSNRIFLKYGENKYRFLRRLLTAFTEITQFVYVSGPKKNLYMAANNYLKKNKVDAIVATGDPFILFYYASKLSKKFNVPWFADYRDPWSHDKGFQINKLYHFWNKKNETKAVTSSKAIITVSDFISDKLHEYFPSKIIYVLPNGYDPEVIDKIAKSPQEAQKLTISFVGTVYEWHPWKSFITIFSELIETKKVEMQLNIYGINIAEEAADFINTFPHKTVQSIKIHPRIPNQDLLNKLAAENIMLLFNNFSFMGTKIFDYIGAKRKIILCYGNDKNSAELKAKFYSIVESEKFSNKLQEDLIRETNSGIIVENENHLKEVLFDLFIEFKQNGYIKCDSTGVENFSRKIQVEKLATIIKNLS